MTGVTWKRPSSKTRAENPVLWCEPRIFWTRIRRWISTSEIGCILSSIIPSARYVSSRRGCGASSPRYDASDAASASTRVVAPRSRSHSNSRNNSVRRASNFARTSSASSEAMTTRSRGSMNVAIFFAPMDPHPASWGQRSAARAAGSVEFPIEIGVDPGPEHFGQGERPEAVDRVPLVVAHRGHAAVRAEVPDLRVDRVLVAAERRVRRREEPAFVDRFRVRLARHLRVLGRLEFGEVDQEELPEALLFDRAQGERGVPEGLRRAEHPVREEVQEPLKCFLSRWHGHLPGIRSCRTVPQDLLHLLRRSFHRQEDKPEIRVVVHEGHQERLVPRAEAEELPFVGLDDRAHEPALGELDRRHLRRADDRRRHRGHHLRIHSVRKSVRNDETVSPHDRRRLDVRHTGEFVDRLLEAHPNVRHAGTSAALSTSEIDWTARSTLRRRRPMFASLRTIVTRIASSPAPVAIILPICVSTMDELNVPRPISTTAISDVPTIAAAIAAIFFGSIVFGGHERSGAHPGGR